MSIFFHAIQEAVDATRVMILLFHECITVYKSSLTLKFSPRLLAMVATVMHCYNSAFLTRYFVGNQYMFHLGPQLAHGPHCLAVQKPTWTRKETVGLDMLCQTHSVDDATILYFAVYGCKTFGVEGFTKPKTRGNRNI